jgi:transcriptional regulator with XRE-family HTH domain
MNTQKEGRNVSLNFGSLLKYYREELGLSLSQLQEKTGISSSYLNRLENGERRGPTVKIIELLSIALGIEMGNLIDIAIKSDDELKDISSIILGCDYTIDDEPVSADIKRLLMNIINFIISNDIDYLDRAAGISEIVKRIRNFKCSLDYEGIEENPE